MPRGQAGIRQTPKQAAALKAVRARNAARRKKRTDNTIKPPKKRTRLQTVTQGIQTQKAKTGTRIRSGLQIGTARNRRPRQLAKFRGKAGNTTRKR